MEESFKTFVFTVESGGERLDRLIVDAIGDMSRTAVQRLIKSGMVSVGGRDDRPPGYRPHPGETIVVRIPPPPEATTEPENIPLDVLYEDDDLIAINKPAGMVVHPAHGHRSGTLVNAVLARWPQTAAVGGRDRSGIVHRLDKDTSGVILIAKTEKARNSLATQFLNREVKKKYLALVEGHPPGEHGIIEAPIGRDPRNRKRMAVVPNGREAVTGFRVLERFENHALLELTPRTGRTHQIRVHLAFIGHPVVGDTVYGRRRPTIEIGRFFLHAASLTVRSPSTGDILTFTAPLPPELQLVLDALRS